MSELNKIKNAHFAYLANASAINEKIVEGFMLNKDDDLTKKTHLFEGRYENIYIDREKIPEIKQIIGQAINFVAEILELNTEQLQCGFWFNSMQPGDVTKPHTHDDDDELMSGVYYIEVPESSGRLLLGITGHHVTIEPEAGKMVFFKPNVVHEVTKNLSQHHRLSIGMNFGLKKEFKPDEEA